MTMQKINFGEQNWDKPLSANLADLYAGGAISDTGWQYCGNLVNGAKPAFDDKAQRLKRRVINYGKFKLVKIAAEITMDPNAIDTLVPIATLPQGCPTSTGKGLAKLMPGSFTTTVRWQMPADGTKILLTGIKLDMRDEDHLWLPIDFCYISNND